MHLIIYTAVTLSLSWQYNNGIPEGSRFANHKDFFKDTLNSLNEEEGKKKLEKVRALTQLAETGERHYSEG